MNLNNFIRQKQFYKNNKFCSPDKIYDTEKMLRKKIIYLKKIYKFGTEHFSIEIISFV